MIKINLQLFGGRGAGSNGSAYLGKKGASRDVDTALATTNPHYLEDRKWQENCQRCVVAYEMQRRGYNVEALPNDTNNKEDVKWANMFHRSFEQTHTEQVVPMKLGITNSELKESIDGRMSNWGEGSRAFVEVEWRTGYREGHVFLAEYKNGKTNYYDPQRGKKINVDDYFSLSVKGHTRIARVDNLTPNYEVMQHMVKKKER